MNRGFSVIFMGLLILLAVIACHTSAQNSENSGEEVLGGANQLESDRALILTNNASEDVTVFIVFVGGLTGNGGDYTIQYFKDQSCDNSYDPYGREDRCSITIPQGQSKTLKLGKGGIDLSGGLGREPMGPCPTTMFEINMSPPDNPTTDHFDLSLVNGFNYAMQVQSSKGFATKYVKTAKGNQDAVGVFPLGCSACVAKGSVPPSFSRCPNSSSCGGQCFDPAECNRVDDCPVSNVPTGGYYTVVFEDPSH